MYRAHPNAPAVQANEPPPLPSAPVAGAPPGAASGRNKKQLAAEARTMLNQLVDLFRTEANVDVSGQNLMDDGVAYIVEGLAFNKTCKVAKLSSNGAGAAAAAQIATVLQVCCASRRACSRCEHRAPSAVRACCKRCELT